MPAVSSGLSDEVQDSDFGFNQVAVFESFPLKLLGDHFHLVNGITYPDVLACNKFDNISSQVFSVDFVIHADNGAFDH